MFCTTNIQQLLALHYVYPLTLNKLHNLLTPTNYLKDLENFPVHDLAKLLNINIEKATKIKNSYCQILTFPLIDVYQREGIQFVPYTHKMYPKSLLTLVDPPTVLYVKGDLQLLGQAKRIAVIGARNATNYSLQALKLILPPLIENQLTIISGLAKGADTFAHQLTIKYGGRTIGVLGSGFYHHYPKENQTLANQMAQSQLLVTEYPPYVKPEKWHFPMRNRIISGLSQALVVTEAALRSGTLITVNHALEHGKDVFVVPGPITSSLSLGTNNLIKEGAIPIWNGYQIVEEIQLFSR